MAGISALAVFRPVTDTEEALKRCLWPVGTFLLLTQNMYPWYALWLVPLLVSFVRPGLLGIRLDAWAGWFLFSGSVVLYYTYFIGWQEIPWTAYAEFAPLYALLALRLAVRLARLGHAKTGWSVGHEPSAASHR